MQITRVDKYGLAAMLSLLESPATHTYSRGGRSFRAVDHIWAPTDSAKSNSAGAFF